MCLLSSPHEPRPAEAEKPGNAARFCSSMARAPRLHANTFLSLDKAFLSVEYCPAACYFEKLNSGPVGFVGGSGVAARATHLPPCADWAFLHSSPKVPSFEYSTCMSLSGSGTRQFLNLYSEVS